MDLIGPKHDVHLVSTNRVIALMGLKVICLREITADAIAMHEYYY